MFLILSLMVVSVVYWFSALSAELFFNSSEENALPVVIKTCFGFFFSLLYFAAAWQFVSIQNAWLFGALLSAIYLYGKYGDQLISIPFSRIKTNFREHLKYYFVFLVGANIFFAPLIVANNFGPFTEGGGDVSIYADVTKLYTDNNLTGKAEPGGLSNIAKNMTDAYKSLWLDTQSRDVLEQARFKAFKRSDLDPPTAESAANTIRATRVMGSVLYAPYGTYSFLSGETNYHVFFGIQAFLYSIILVGIWTLFRRLSPGLAVIAFLVTLMSHGLISVSYNMYAAQTLSLAFSILLLNALPYIRLNSWAGLRTYGVGIICLWAMYFHFLTITLPLTILAWSNRYFNLFNKKEPDNQKIVGAGISRKVFSLTSILMFLSAVLMLLVTSAANSISWIKSLLTNVITGAYNQYFGVAHEFLDWKSVSFVFGILSQQHYAPFAKEYSWLNWVVIVGVWLGVGIFLVGGLLMIWVYTTRIRTLRVGKSEERNNSQRGIFLLYLSLIAVIFFHLLVSQTSLYVQAKGAQNIIILVYVALLLPLAIGLSRDGKDLTLKTLTKFLLVLCILFCLVISIPRIVFGFKLAAGENRAVILEPSYFQEAKRIMSSDAKPFVLVEPRKSGDLYISIQPFFGARMVPTRHLILLVRDGVLTSPLDMKANELIGTDDLPHLWILNPGKKAKRTSFGIVDYQWKAEKLIDKIEPYILFAAHDYERDFGERPLDAASDNTRKFSYLRNGMATLYLPAHIAGNLTVTLEPRDENNYEKMSAEIEDRLKKGELGSNVVKVVDGKFIRLVSTLMDDDEPKLINIAHYSGEFWLNVELNGKSL